MKKSILIPVAILTTSFVLTSYSSKATAPKDSIVGIWEYRDVTFDVKTSEKEATAKIISYFSDDDDEDQGQGLLVEFTEDGRMIDSKAEEELTYSISEDEMIITFEKGSSKCNFKIKDDVLSLLINHSNAFTDKDLRKMIGINDSVKIEKAIIMVNLVRKK